MIKDYEKEFLNNASRFDAVFDACGEVTKLATELVKSRSDEVCKKILKKIELCPKKDKKNSVISIAFYNSLIALYGADSIRSISQKDKCDCEEDSRSLDELLEDLNALIGLNKVKKQVNDLLAFQKIQQKRKEKGLRLSKKTLHLAFLGNPGTGKTTVARIIGHIYKNLGMLSKGHFIEVSRTDLIAGYQGQTAHKVKEVVERAKGGVLFIDEAYSITENDHSDSYGRECLTELTKALEDYRDDLVVIVAGYKEPMQKFFDSNPGLKSRFNTFIDFDDYSAKELLDILDSICKKNDYELAEDLKNILLTFFELQISKNEENFANGRISRNVFDDLIMGQARRLEGKLKPSKKELMKLEVIDFDENHFIE